jgi:hypothetical protein
MMNLEPRTSAHSPSNLSQFNLRTLFAAVAVLALICAIARYGGWAGLLAASTFAALIAAHVVGNALGTRLRDEVSPQLNAKPITPATRPFGPRIVTVPRRLHERTPIGRLILVTSTGAAGVGGILGGLALAFWTGASFAGWLVGTLSSALLGGFFGFLLASFLEMTLGAWWQAAGETKKKSDRTVSS